MSIYIHDWNVLDKIAEVEGQSWKNHQIRQLQYHNEEPERFNLNYTVWGSLERWNEREEWNESFGTIYGDGGWNRYFVRKDGHVAFSRYHTSSTGIERATKAGFDIE